MIPYDDVSSVSQRLCTLSTDSRSAVSETELRIFIAPSMLFYTGDTSFFYLQECETKFEKNQEYDWGPYGSIYEKTQAKNLVLLYL